MRDWLHLREVYLDTQRYPYHTSKGFLWGSAFGTTPRLQISESIRHKRRATLGFRNPLDQD